MSGPTLPASKPRRRRFTLSLRVSMLAVLVVGLAMGWKARRASTQRRAVAAIRAAGGAVVYDSQMAGLNYLPFQSLNDSLTFPPGRTWAPGWLRRAIGDEYFQEVAGVWLNHGPNSERSVTGATDDLMRLLGGLDGLVLLQIHDAGITDAGMVHLRGLTRLRGLMLHGVTITDAGLENLRGMTDLEELHVFSHPNPITNAGMVHLAGLTRLRTLHLSYARVDDPALANLSGLTRLESLDIHGSRIADGGMAHLATLTSLKYLGMNCSPGFTDAGLATLAKLSRLESVSLFDTGSTDAGLAPLAALTRLEQLQLYGAKKLTGTGASALVDLPLKSLDFGSCAVDEAGMKVLGRLSRLTNLRLQANPGVDDDGLAHLRGLPALVYLDLGSTNASPSGATRLQAGLPLLEVTIQSGAFPLPARGTAAR